MDISTISNAIKALFNDIRKPAQELPSPVMAIGASQRPGMSTITSSANVAKVLEAHGIPTTAADDGSENKTMVLVIAIVEEVLRAIKEDANIQVAFKPGDISILANGANAAGPVVSKGINTNFPHGVAVIQ